MARDLKFQILVVDGLYYPYSESKGADQLRGYREADLRLCFRICKKPVFSGRGSYILQRNGAAIKTFKFNMHFYRCMNQINNTVGMLLYVYVYSALPEAHNVRHAEQRDKCYMSNVNCHGDTLPYFTASLSLRCFMTV